MFNKVFQIDTDEEVINHTGKTEKAIIAGKMAVENNIPAILVATGKATVEELKQYSEFVFNDFGENKWQEVVMIINQIKA